MSAHQTTETRDRNHQLNVRVLRFRHSPEREEPALLARELLQLGRHADALELTELALAREPGDVDLEMVRAQALLAAGDAYRGEESLIRVAKSAPQWAAPLSALTRLLSSRGDDQRAIRLAQKARTLGADDTMVGRLTERDELHRKLDQRIERFRRDAGAEEPVLLAKALEDADRKDDAARVLREALVREPDDADTLAALARIERAQGHADEAVALYRKAREAAPGWEPVERALFSLVGIEVPIEITEPARLSAFGTVPSIVVDDAVYEEARALELDAQLDAMMTPRRADATVPYAMGEDTMIGAPAETTTLVGMPAPVRGYVEKPRASAPVAAAAPVRRTSGFPTRPMKRTAKAPVGYVRVLAGDARRHV